MQGSDFKISYASETSGYSSKIHGAHTSNTDRILVFQFALFTAVVTPQLLDRHKSCQLSILTVASVFPLNPTIGFMERETEMSRSSAAHDFLTSTGFLPPPRNLLLARALLRRRHPQLCWSSAGVVTTMRCRSGETRGGAVNAEHGTEVGFGAGDARHRNS